MSMWLTIFLPMLLSLIESVSRYFQKDEVMRGDLEMLDRFLSHETQNIIRQVTAAGQHSPVLTDVRVEFRDYEHVHTITYSFVGDFHIAINLPREYVFPNIDLARMARMAYEFELARMMGDNNAAHQWRELAAADYHRRMMMEEPPERFIEPPPQVGRNMTATEVRERQNHYRRRVADAFRMPNAVINQMAERARAAMLEEAYRRAHPHTYDMPQDVVPGGVTVIAESQKALKRSLELLMNHLSEQQRKQFKTTERFLVTGCDTGRIYRIDKSTSYNIACVLTEDRWCFLPKGNLQIGDVMLAQKIALETKENESLKIANHHPNKRTPRHTVQDGITPVGLGGVVMRGGGGGGGGADVMEWNVDGDVTYTIGHEGGAGGGGR